MIDQLLRPDASLAGRPVGLSRSLCGPQPVPRPVPGNCGDSIVQVRRGGRLDTYFQLSDPAGQGVGHTPTQQNVDAKGRELPGATDWWTHKWWDLDPLAAGVTNDVDNQQSSGGEATPKPPTWRGGLMEGGHETGTTTRLVFAFDHSAQCGDASCPVSASSWLI